MTEAEWITTNNMPLYMLREYPGEWSGRKVRLFWCACLRRAWNQLTDERTQRLVEEVERQPEADAGWFIHERNFALEIYRDFVNTESAIYHDYWAFDAFLGTPPGSLTRLMSDLAHSAGDRATRNAEVSVRDTPR